MDTPANKKSIAINVQTYSITSPSAKIEFVLIFKVSLANLIIIIKIGMMTGNPNMAVNGALLSAFEEIAEIKVKVIDKPTLAKNKTMKKNKVSNTGLSMIKL